ncbi:MAG: DUF4301 family protein [Ignavibacteriaceae bacterium]|nr:DUF4301 family protein [Ignavibacteriaceae bacterium]
MTKTEIENLKEELLKEQHLEIPVEKILAQIKIFEKGIPYLKLVKPCTVGDGIKIISANEQQKYINIFHSALEEGRIIKFVPASGAATRMFKKQLSVLVKYDNPTFREIKDLGDNGDEDCKATIEFFENIHRFAFYDELKKVISKSGKQLEDLITKEKVADIVRFVAESVGLNYAKLPKGSILFHSYLDGARTPFEEHLIEAMNYSAGKDKMVRIHFTISQEHETEVKKLFNSLIEKYSRQGWKFDVQFSFQSPSTDTISVTPDNKLFRDEKGKILLRPGGHGALLKNLNDLKADIVSIKNIDNIVPDHLRDETYKYKKILGGYLISLQEKVFSMLHNLEKDLFNESSIKKVVGFIKDEFEVDLSDQLKSKTFSEQKNYLFNFLNRPIRICGMVKKENHPGGSPLWVEGDKGELTKQIVETAQVDLSDRNQVSILENATHFNPVDIACGVKDYKGNNFDLQKFSNPETGLITKKSKDGKDLKALELPGLWNGGMYYWLTVFVEVPKITFNPVKEVNDLLKPEHQPLKS